MGCEIYLPHVMKLPTIERWSRAWFPCFHSLPQGCQWKEPCYRKLCLCAKQCHLIEGWMRLDEPPPCTPVANFSSEHFSGLPLWLAQSLRPGFKATVQRGPGDHGYYKKVKVRGQRKMGRVFSAWGFERHLSCHLPSFFFYLSGTYIWNSSKYFYALMFLKKAYKMWEFNVSENKDCCLCSLSGSGS